MRGARLLAAGLALIAGCAPAVRPVAEIADGERRQRFVRALAERERRAAFAEAEATVWVRGSALGRLPAVQTVVSLARPDAFRLRAESMFGTAFDVSLAGDSLRAAVPARRVAVALDARRDSMAVTRPGELAVRVWSATWRPPDAAWKRAVFEDSLQWLRWAERGDSVAIGIGSNGLPAAVRYARGAGGIVVAEYRGWQWLDGAWWPGWIEAREDGGALSVTTRIQRVRFLSAAPADRLAIRVPHGSRWLGREEILEMIEDLGVTP
jgi:hypothetical protein